MKPSRYMVRLHGGPFDGHHCEVVFPPRAIFVWQQDGGVRVDDQQPDVETWTTYRQIDVHGHIADYAHQGVKFPEPA